MAIHIANIGEGGVNVDMSPLLTADNETTECQNAGYDSTRQRQGGLTKRPGLAKFNTRSFDAKILGGTEAPFTGVATAIGGS